MEDKIKNYHYTKYAELLNIFKGKAIELLDDLTQEYKETLAEDVDSQIENWKQNYEEVLNSNSKKDEEIKQLKEKLQTQEIKAVISTFDIIIADIKRVIEFPINTSDFYDGYDCAYKEMLRAVNSRRKEYLKLIDSRGQQK